MRTSLQKKKIALGFSLVEIIVSIAILALIMVFSLGILPSAYLAIRKSSNYHFASNLAVNLMERAANLPLPSMLVGTKQLPEYSVPADLFKTAVFDENKISLSWACPTRNPGKVVHEIDGKKLSFYYLVTYYNLKEEDNIKKEMMQPFAYNTSGPSPPPPIESAFSSVFVDITVDIWWDDNEKPVQFKDMVGDETAGIASKLSLIRYMQRVYKPFYSSDSDKSDKDD